VTVSQEPGYGIWTVTVSQEPGYGKE